MTEQDTISVASFRDGIPFAPIKPNADGYAEIMDMLEGPKGKLFITVTYHVLLRSFPNVTREEVGQMEFSDLMPLVKVGIDGLNDLDILGFQDT